jgi:hypothetical protein
MGTRTLCLLLLGAAWMSCGEKYDGPVPPKTDLPYLLHAKTLTETEAAKARDQSRKNETAYIIAGTSSPAKTPLAEPIFILDARQISPEHLELFQLEVKDGNREVSVSTKGHKGSSRIFYLRVTPLGEHLFRIEASEPLENGEYALTPEGDNRVFCFEVY